MFLVMALLGQVIFGRDSEEFSTLLRSLVSCFRMLFGDVEWVVRRGKVS